MDSVVKMCRQGLVEWESVIYLAIQRLSIKSEVCFDVELMCQNCEVSQVLECFMHSEYKKLQNALYSSLNYAILAPPKCTKGRKISIYIQEIAAKILLTTPLPTFPFQVPLSTP